MLEKSDLIIAQEFLPTAFDWRIGIFDRQPLYACKYYMAKAALADHQARCRRGQEPTTASSRPCRWSMSRSPLSQPPLKAANLIGDGLYGVDLKQSDNKCLCYRGQ